MSTSYVTKKCMLPEVEINEINNFYFLVKDLLNELPPFGKFNSEEYNGY